MGSGKWKKIGEVQTVPTATPKVRNKFTVAVADFADGIQLSKNLFDDNMHKLISWLTFAKKLTLCA
jgi:hypothetical protein